MTTSEITEPRLAIAERALALARGFTLDPNGYNRNRVRDVVADALAAVRGDVTCAACVYAPCHMLPKDAQRCSSYRTSGSEVKE